MSKFVRTTISDDSVIQCMKDAFKNYELVSWTNIKAQLKAIYDTLYQAIFTTDQAAAITGAASPSASNVFATMDDLPENELTTDEKAAINGAASPSASNVFATMDDLPENELTTDEKAAINGAATPSGSNVFATMNDLPADELTAIQKAATLAIIGYYTPAIQSAATNVGGTLISLTMNLAMADPAANAADFTLKVNGSGAAITSVALHDDDSKVIEITPTVAIVNGNVVTVSIAKGNVKGEIPVLLEAVTDQAVTNNVP